MNTPFQTMGHSSQALGIQRWKSIVNGLLKSRFHFLHCWRECKLVQPLWKTVWRFLKKLKTELSYDPAIPLLDIYPSKPIIQKYTCSPMLIAALLTIAKTWEQSKCPSTDEWVKKMQYTYGEGNGNPLQYSGLENPMDRGACQATAHGVAKSQKRLSDLTSLISLTSYYHWRRNWQPTPVFLPGKPHGQRSLADHGPCGCRESDMTEVTQHKYLYTMEYYYLVIIKDGKCHLH